mmetsp:Transcript_24767/g.58141  ORF Transcript_24767/g.58141 Transcript_24767/m.58141 type:complete len:81 (+) Transcript_24767:59-301(+)
MCTAVFIFGLLATLSLAIDDHDSSRFGETRTEMYLFCAQLFVSANPNQTTILRGHKLNREKRSNECVCIGMLIDDRRKQI